MKKLRIALVDLYITVKIRKLTGQHDFMDQKKYQNEFEKLATSKTDTLTLVEYLARQIETVF